MILQNVYRALQVFSKAARSRVQVQSYSTTAEHSEVLSIVCLFCMCFEGKKEVALKCNVDYYKLYWPIKLLVIA